MVLCAPSLYRSREQNTKINEFSSGGICLDDLFKKTKTVPSVYWLPLTDEEIKARDDAREERKKAREERRKASEERRTKPRKRSRR